MRNKFLLSIIAIALIFFSFPAKAQLDLFNAFNNQNDNNTGEVFGLSLKTSSLPALANSLAIVSAEVNGGQTNTLDFSWFFDGDFAPSQSGINKPMFSFLSGKSGQKHTISLRLKTADGKIFEDVIIIPVNDLTVLWEADTLTPYDFPGRKLATQGSQITVAAITDIASNHKTVNFTWILDDQVQFNQSGLGKDSFTFQTVNNPRNKHEIIVETLANDKKLSKIIIIPISEPIIQILSKNQLSGIKSKQIPKISAGSEITLEAKPLFFTKQKNNLFFEWFFNQNLINKNSRQGENVLTLDIPADYKNKTIDIKVKISNKNFIFQSGIASILLNIR